MVTPDRCEAEHTMLRELRSIGRIVQLHIAVGKSAIVALWKAAPHWSRAVEDRQE